MNKAMKLVALGFGVMLILLVYSSYVGNRRIAEIEQERSALSPRLQELEGLREG